MVIHVVVVVPKACVKRPCQNGATCHGDDNVYYCECPRDYIGIDCEGKYVICLYCKVKQYTKRKFKFKEFIRNNHIIWKQK